ncbi:hypothetical protein ACFL6F_00405 [Planctomycetota bacterium]
MQISKLAAVIFVMLCAGFLCADDFEPFVYSLDAISRMTAGDSDNTLKQLKNLDPDRNRTFKILTRIFSPDTSDLEHIVAELNNEDYSVRSSAAQRILTYSLQDIKDLLVKEELRTGSPERLFQISKVQYELRNNYYLYRKKIVIVRNNMLLYLAYSADPRFFPFARKLYTEGSIQDKQSVLDLAGLFKGEGKLKFLTDVFSLTKGALVYSLFYEMRDELNTSEVKSIAGVIVKDAHLPPLLRATAAVSILQAGFKMDLSGQADPFIRNILETKEPLSNAKWVDGASSEMRTFPRDTVKSIDYPGCKGWITGIDLLNGVICDTGKKVHMVPLFRVDEIRMVPTGRRHNKDYTCRVVFHDGDSLSGTPLEMGKEGIVIENSYLRYPVAVKPDHVAVIQFNTENRSIPSVQVNSLKAPVVHLKNGDAVSGYLIQKKGEKPGVELTGFTVFTDPRSKPIKTLYIDTDSIERVEFPVKGYKKSLGFCRVTTLYGDRLSGNLMKMGGRYLTLYSEVLGKLFVSRDKIGLIAVNSGFSIFREYVVMTFPGQDTVCVYNLNGDKVWEKTGLKDPVYAEQMPNGDICVCERVNGTLSIYSKDYLLKKEYKGFDNISSAHVLPNGNLLVACERPRDAVVEIDPAGNTVNRYDGLTFVIDAVQRPDRKVIAISKRRRRIALLGPGKNEALRKDYIGSPLSIQLLENGNVLVSSRSSIAEYSDKFVKKNKTEIKQFSMPRALLHGKGMYCIDQNFLYKLDNKENIIRKVQLPETPESIYIY